MSYKMANDAISAIMVTFKGIKDLFLRLRETGRTGMDQSVLIKVRKEVEDAIGLEQFYRIEEETLEKKN